MPLKNKLFLYQTKMSLLQETLRVVIIKLRMKLIPEVCPSAEFRSFCQS